MADAQDLKSWVRNRTCRFDPDHRHQITFMGDFLLHWLLTFFAVYYIIDIMIKTVLDIWAIQNNPDELYAALQNITHDVLIFKNLICKFLVGNKTIKTTQFDNIIYSEGSDMLILLQRDGKAKIEDAERYLQKKNIMYNVVEFIDVKPHEKPKKAKEFWFAREQYVLEDAIEDSKRKKITHCSYYPEVRSKMIFKYPTFFAYRDVLVDNPNYISNEPMMKIAFKGVIEFDDKLILPTVSKDRKNLHSDDILNTLSDYGIKTEIKNSVEQISF